MTQWVKIVVFVPGTHADQIRTALQKAGAGKLGGYDSDSFSSKGIGRFRPLKGANPAIGKIGEVEEVEEEKIETICSQDNLDTVLKAIKKVHPYEEPAIDVFPLMNINL